jgi:hypothetical protein
MGPDAGLWQRVLRHILAGQPHPDSWRSLLHCTPPGPRIRPQASRQQQQQQAEEEEEDRWLGAAGMPLVDVIAVSGAAASSCIGSTSFSEHAIVYPADVDFSPCGFNGMPVTSLTHTTPVPLHAVQPWP